MNLEDEFNALLAETLSHAMERERTAWQKLTAPGQESLVLFGAGGLGRRILVGLRQAGVEPRAFADNNPARWGTSESGVPILSPAEAADRFGKTTVFVVTIWNAGPQHRTRDLSQQLVKLGCRSVTSVCPLFWKFPDIFLPHCYLDLPHKVLADRRLIRCVFSRLADRESREVFVSQLRCRLLGDFDTMPTPVPEAQYWPRGIINFDREEYFVDCGAFDGDTIRELVRGRRCGVRKLSAFEPDPANFKRLQESVLTLPNEVRSRIDLCRAAVGSTSGKLRFNADASASSAAAGSGTPIGIAASDGERSVEVQCVALDDALKDEQPTYIKMDVEGYELAALEGARNIIADHQPILAVCAYHLQDHLWRIPSLISSIGGQYRIYFRVHASEGDLVCYAVPPPRLLYSAESQQAENR